MGAVQLPKIPVLTFDYFLCRRRVTQQQLSEFVVLLRRKARDLPFANGMSISESHSETPEHERVP